MGSLSHWLRFAGIILLAILLWQVDFSKVTDAIRQVNPTLFAIAIVLNIPQIFTKAYRWRGLMRAHGIQYGVYPAVLSYFGSIFIGLLTPGRLGEFVKTVHVSRDCNVPASRAFSSVLVDRLFDLYALLLFGGTALLSSAQQSRTFLIFAEVSALMVLPLIFILHDSTFEKIKNWGVTKGKIGQKLFGEGSWLVELRNYLKSLSWQAVLTACFLTSIAYALFFTQCYLLALGIDLKASFLTVSFAVALGSLVTLIPLSISGLGTREAAMIAYLGTAGITSAKSLAYSLLLFVTFYVAGALMGAIAWMIKPAPLKEIRK